MGTRRGGKVVNPGWEGGRGFIFLTCPFLSLSILLLSFLPCLLFNFFYFELILKGKSDLLYQTIWRRISFDVGFLLP